MKLQNRYFYIIVLCSVVIIDICFGIILRKSFDKIDIGNYGRINTLFSEKYDIIILGSSRTLHHYDDSLLSEKLNLSVYNSGLEGYGIYSDYALLKTSLDLYQPKIVILDISANIIADTESPEKLMTFLPYYSRYPAYKEILKSISNVNYITLLSQTYRYNSSFYYMFKSYITESGRYGYIPIEGEVNMDTKLPMHYENQGFDQRKLEYFRKIMKLCKRHEVKLFIVNSPEYIPYDSEDEIISPFKVLAEKENIQMLDYRMSPIFRNNSDLFYDQLHLNKKGATLFTNEIITFLTNLKGAVSACVE